MCISFDPIIPLLGISPTKIVAWVHRYKDVHSSMVDINSRKLGTVYMSISRRMVRQMMAQPHSVILCSCSKEWGSSAWIGLERCPWWGFKWKTKVKKHKACSSVKTVILKQKQKKPLKTLLLQIPRCWLKYIKNCFKCKGEFVRNGNPQVSETKRDLQIEAVSCWLPQEPGAGFWYLPGAGGRWGVKAETPAWSWRLEGLQGLHPP